MNMMSPPTGVHASPVATPTSASRPATSLWTLGWPANFSRFFAVILMVAARPSTTSRAALRSTPWISRSSWRTPASRVGAHLVHLVEHQQGIARLAALQRVDDATRERAHVGAPMAADLRLVAHPTQRHAGEAAPQRLRDALPERGLAHAGRTHETQNAAARRGVEGADRQVLKDPLLDGLQVVVVAVEDVARGLQVEPVLRRAAPGQRRDHLEVRAGHMVLGRLRRHLAQA